MKTLLLGLLLGFATGSFDVQADEVSIPIDIPVSDQIKALELLGRTFKKLPQTFPQPHSATPVFRLFLERSQPGLHDANDDTFFTYLLCAHSLSARDALRIDILVVEEKSDPDDTDPVPPFAVRGHQTYLNLIRTLFEKNGIRVMETSGKPYKDESRTCI